MTPGCANRCILERFLLHGWRGWPRSRPPLTLSHRELTKAPLVENPAPIVSKAEIIWHAIGASDQRYKKYELDSVDACLYRLRIREKTVD